MAQALPPSLRPTYDLPQKRAIERCETLQKGVKAFTILALVAFVASAVFVILALMDYVHPYVSLYAFGGSMVCLLILFLIRCWQQSIAAEVGLDFNEMIKVWQPPPEKKSDKK